MEKKIALALICVFSIAHLISASVVRSSYGQSCNKTQRCNSRAWLSCVNGICDCTKQEEMLFDEEKEKCLTKSGERCRYGLEEGGDNVFVEVTQCVPNAMCSIDGLCVCDGSHHETVSGVCALSNLFGEKCTEQNECSLQDGLKCVEGICKCNAAISTIYSNTCIGLSGNPCVEGKCVQGANCENGACVCDEDHYHNTSNSMCIPKKKAFEVCNKDEECINNANLNLSCFDGICKCDTRTHAYAVVQKFEYNDNYRMDYNYPISYWIVGFQGAAVEMCAPIVGQSCPNGYCTSGAKCVVIRDYVQRSNKYELGKCECIEGNDLKQNGYSCGLIHGERCARNEDCIDGLECSNRKCACPFRSHQTFVSANKACITIVRARCTKDSICSANAFCKFANESVHGHCECAEGFVEDENKLCDAEFGQSCSEEFECDSVASLVCLNKVCACPDQMYRYAAKQRKCVGLVGATCDDTDKGDSCVENAECVKEHPKLKGTCVCKSGFLENSTDATCQLSA